MQTKHTFVICAYGESPYLEQCICSLKKQTVPVTILMATSTPLDGVKKMAEKYDIPLYINTGEHGIAHDWNFAMSCADSELVTIAHQDDYYEETFAETMQKSLQDDDLIGFTDYYEIRNGRKVEKNRLLRIKRILLTPLRFTRKNRFIRRRCLSFGNPICCPSVTYVMKNLEMPIFRQVFRSNIDWEAWERLAKLPGGFRYIHERLTGHRIHEGSETSATILEHLRTNEDLEMFRRFWPEWFARFINHIYATAEKSNYV
ncbi:MAG: glycosyltransferase family 2 protein [Lachnospiraceae bacterium]|nr:glycosyltransferase family 2 protein [Lachnospiraceae bacterium]